MSAARNKRRRHGRRGRFGFLYKMLAVIALTAAVLLGTTVFFRVEQIQVKGNMRYTAQQVEQVSGVVQGDNLFHMNKYEVARTIRRELPYIQAVNIRRSLPDTLIINVTECRAAACLVGGEQEWLISAAGKVLESVAPGEATVTLIEGLTPVQPEPGYTLTVREDQQLRTQGLIDLLQVLDGRHMLGRVKSIDIKSDAGIFMELDDRFRVKLPIGGDYAYLISAMDKAIDSLDSYEKGTLDLTVKDYTVIFSPA